MQENTHAHPGEVEITFAFSRHLGPRFMHGGVTLQFHGASSFVFRSEASWPQDNYDEHVRRGVEEVLASQEGRERGVAVVLKSIAWDPVSSCAEGFRRAAAAATRASLQV